MADCTGHLGIKAAFNPGLVYSAAHIYPWSPAKQNLKHMSMHLSILRWKRDHCNLNEKFVCCWLALQECDLTWHHRVQLELAASANKHGHWSHFIMGFLSCISVAGLCTLVLYILCATATKESDLTRTSRRKIPCLYFKWFMRMRLYVQSTPNMVLIRHQPVALKVGKYTWNVYRNAEPLCSTDM